MPGPWAVLLKTTKSAQADLLASPNSIFFGHTAFPILHRLMCCLIQIVAQVMLKRSVYSNLVRVVALPRTL
jgi:hypothetical protein